MSVHQVTYYQAKCDRCEFVLTDYGDYAAWGDADQAIESAIGYAEWQLTDENRLFCLECAEVISQLEDQ